MDKRKMQWHVGLLAITAVGVVLGGRAVAVSKARAPRTVVEYYMLLPDQYFETSNRKHLLDARYGGIVDVKNGYLHAWGDGAQAEMDVCLFKRPDRSYLVAVNQNHASDGVWEPSPEFYAYRHGHLVDVTRATLPRRFSKNLGYKLPRYGTMIGVINEAGKTIYHLVWAKGRFRVKRTGG